MDRTTIDENGLLPEEEQAIINADESGKYSIEELDYLSEYIDNNGLDKDVDEIMNDFQEQEQADRADEKLNQELLTAEYYANLGVDHS